MNPGRELDALVAEKVMGIPIKKGYLKHLYARSLIGSYPVIAFQETPFEDLLLLPHPPNDEEHWEIPEKGFQTLGFDPCPKYYSTDISAAWEVVEKLQERWENFSLSRSGMDGGWTIGLSSWAKVYPNPFVFESRRLHAPHAICLAALKVMGVEI